MENQENPQLRELYFLEAENKKNYKRMNILAIILNPFVSSIFLSPFFTVFFMVT
jgi:hypothetical protein